MRNRKAVVSLFALLLLPACGGGSSPAAPPPPTAPPTTLPNFSGAYSGFMDYNVGGAGVLRVLASTTVTHTGNTISSTNLVMILPNGTTSIYPLGSATLSGDQYIGGTTFQSSGCGVTTVHTITRFGGRQMNLTIDLASSCNPSHIVGELSRP